MDANNTENESTPGTEADSSDDSVVDVTTVAKLPPKMVTFPAPSIEEPFAPTIEGLEEARLRCRFMMNRIVQEVRGHRPTSEFDSC